jgi:hypothetical protein
MPMEIHMVSSERSFSDLVALFYTGTDFELLALQTQYEKSQSEL